MCRAACRSPCGAICERGLAACAPRVAADPQGAGPGAGAVVPADGRDRQPAGLLPRPGGPAGCTAARAARCDRPGEDRRGAPHPGRCPSAARHRLAHRGAAPAGRAGHRPLSQAGRDAGRLLCAAAGHDRSERLHAGGQPLLGRDARHLDLRPAFLAARRRAGREGGGLGRRGAGGLAGQRSGDLVAGPRTLAPGAAAAPGRVHGAAGLRPAHRLRRARCGAAADPGPDRLGPGAAGPGQADDRQCLAADAGAPAGRAATR